MFGLGIASRSETSLRASALVVGGGGLPFARPQPPFSATRADFVAVDGVLSAPFLGWSALSLPSSATDFGLSAADLPLFATVLRLSGAEDTLSVTDKVLSEADKGSDAPQNPLSKADHQSSGADNTRSKPSKSPSQRGNCAFSAPKHLFLPQNVLVAQLARYVRETSGNDLAKLLSSGFDAVSTNRSSSPLDVPIIKDITNGMTGQLLVKATPVANARAYEIRYALSPMGGTPGAWQSGGLYTNSRSMPVNGRTPGGNYSFQVRATGGSTGYSDWSNPVGHMSM